MSISGEKQRIHQETLAQLSLSSTFQTRTKVSHSHKHHKLVDLHDFSENVPDDRACKLHSHQVLFASSRFTSCCSSHYLALVVGLIFLVLAVFAHRRNPKSKTSRITLQILIWGNLLAIFHTSGSHYFSGKTKDLEFILPLHLCDLTALVATAALITRKPLFCELTYYLGLGGTLQGLITPNLFYDFPHPTYFSFFQLHLFVVIAALFLPLATGWRPRSPLPKTMLRTFLIICSYLLIIYGVNTALDTNYAFLMHKPRNPSLYDHLGPHPYYILSVLGLVIMMLMVLSLPFARKKANS